jgi:hypothetical protein
MNKTELNINPNDKRFERGDFYAYKMTPSEAESVARAYMSALQGERRGRRQKIAAVGQSRPRPAILRNTYVGVDLWAKLIVITAIAFFCVKAAAKTDPANTLDQLKVNAENSEFNYRQYQDNLDVVNKNVEQSDKAAQELRALKKQLISNTQNVDKNKKSLAEVQIEIQKLKKKEQDRLAQDEKQILEVKKILEKLEANKQKRLENVTAYDQMNTQVEQEIKEWDTQVQQMATLQKELDAKEKRAVDEKVHWQAKRKDYEAESKKWSAQAKSSKATYDKYKKMND